MRLIPTTPAKVETLKKQAKRLQRNGGGKHADLLDRVAKANGYDHWHHVVLCLKEATGVHQSRGLIPEVEAIVEAALNRVDRLVATGPEASGSQSFLLLSFDGDAWMLDPEGDHLLCLVWRGERQNYAVRDLPTRIEVEWDGHFELLGPLFAVLSEHPAVGNRHIRGYPVERIRQILEGVRSADRRIEQIFAGDDQVSLSPDIIAQLVRNGWDEARVTDAARQGANYSPSRDTLLFPPVGNL